MAKLNGTDLLVYVGADAILGTTNHSLSLNMETADATTKDSGGWREIIPTVREWSIDFDGLVDFTASYGLTDLMNLIINRTQSTVKFSTESTGDTYWEGLAYLVNVDQDWAMEDVAAFTGSFEGDGTLTQATVA